MSAKQEYMDALHCRVRSEPTTALYCRTAAKSNSTDSTGIENQSARLLSFAAEIGCTNPVLYIDNGESGLTLNRPAMNRLTEDIKSGSVQTVIVTSSSRIARGVFPLIKWVRYLKRTGVRCLSLETGGQDISSEFTFQSNLLNAIISESSKKART